MTPLQSDATAAEQISSVAAHLSSMRVALALDVPVMLVIPAVLFVGLVVGPGPRGWR